jgi:putative restriction endonuclease
MDLFVGFTDGDWYEPLANQPGDLLVFKLHRPLDFIGSDGVLAHSSLLPARLAWESFGIGNGATTIVEMRARIAKYRRQR